MINCDNLILTSSFLSSLASLVEFVNEEKSSLLKKTVQHADFIYATVYSSKHELKLKRY